MHLGSYHHRPTNTIRYAPIFAKPGGLPPRSGPAYHGVSEAVHKKALQDAPANGLVPVNVSVVSIDGQRTFSAFYRHSPNTIFDAPGLMTFSEFDTRFHDNFKKGLFLSHMKAYNHNGTFAIAAIWRDDAKNGATHPAIGEGEFADLLKQQRKLGRALRMVTGGQNGVDTRFIGCWRK